VVSYEEHLVRNMSLETVIGNTVRILILKCYDQFLDAGRKRLLTYRSIIIIAVAVTVVKSNRNNNGSFGGRLSIYILLVLVRGRYAILCSCWVVGFEIELTASLAHMRLCIINSHGKNFEQAVSLHSSCILSRWNCHGT